MKKILFTLLFGLIGLVSNAQTNGIETNQQNVSIDSLQNEYNFLYCDYQLYRLTANLKDLSQDISITCNEISILCHHNVYIKSYYEAVLYKYDSYVYLFNTLKENYNKLQTLISLKYYNLNRLQKEVIDSYFRAINAGIKTVDAALSTYKVCLDSYDTLGRR